MKTVTSVFRFEDGLEFLFAERKLVRLFPKKLNVFLLNSNLKEVLCSSGRLEEFNGVAHLHGSFFVVVPFIDVVDIVGNRRRGESVVFTASDFFVCRFSSCNSR